MKTSPARACRPWRWRSTEIPHGVVRQCGGSQHPAKAELGPKVTQDVVSGNGVPPGLQVAHDLLHPLANNAVDLADGERSRPAVADRPGPHDIGKKIDEGPDHPRRPQLLNKHRLVEAVLHADDVAILC